VDSEFQQLLAEVDQYRYCDPRALEIGERLVHLDPASVDAWEILSWSLYFTLFPEHVLYPDIASQAAADPRMERMVEAWDTLARLDAEAVGAIWNCASALSMAGEYARSAAKYIECGRRAETVRDEYTKPSAAYTNAAYDALRAGHTETLEVALGLWRQALSPDDEDYEDDLEEIAELEEELNP
jgi:hypothetical protein